MFSQNLNSFIAIAMVAAVGIGASYLIIHFANSTDFSVVSTDESIVFTAEIHTGGRAEKQ